MHEICFETLTTTQASACTGPLHGAAIVPARFRPIPPDSARFRTDACMHETLTDRPIPQGSPPTTPFQR